MSMIDSVIIWWFVGPPLVEVVEDVRWIGPAIRGY